LDVSKISFYHDHWLRCIEVETLGGEIKRIGTVPGVRKEGEGEEEEEEGMRKTVLEINGWTGIEDEHISEVRIRAGHWVDGIQVQLSTGRTSGWMGGDGGTLNVLKPPKQKKEEDGRGEYRIVGIYGTASDEFVDSLGIIYFKPQNN
jgi:hypothetical protein